MSNTTRRRTLNNDRIAQAITDTQERSIVCNICDSADKLAKRLKASAIVSDFPSGTSGAAVAESFDYAAHLAKHDSKIESVTSNHAPSPVSGVWKEAGPCHE